MWLVILMVCPVLLNCSNLQTGHATSVLTNLRRLIENWNWARVRALRGCHSATFTTTLDPRQWQGSHKVMEIIKFSNPGKSPGINGKTPWKSLNRIINLKITEAKMIWENGSQKMKIGKFVSNYLQYVLESWIFFHHIYGNPELWRTTSVSYYVITLKIKFVGYYSIVKYIWMYSI